MNLRKKSVIWISLCFLFIGMGFSSFLPISYHIMKPGSVIDVRSLVEVDADKHPKGGTFHLTTVSVRKGMLFDRVASYFNKDMTFLPSNQLLVSGETDQDYEERQQENMFSSQQNAILSAYRLAKREVDIQFDGIKILQIQRTSPLQKGDIIHTVDGKKLNTIEALREYLKGKKEGDSVDVGLVRNKKKLTRKVKLIQLTKESPRVGLGIIPITQFHLKTDPSISIESSDIGGPSAGLMFSLEILNQLHSKDLTKGYEIAGTGTISHNGDVGQIGGMEQKVSTADKAGVHLFFCPKDTQSQDNNEKLAKRKISQLKSDMRIIPVRNLKEAVHFLETLK